jgi:uncharacterized repeat protein (TIGR01451 family)
MDLRPPRTAMVLAYTVLAICLISGLLGSVLASNGEQGCISCGESSVLKVPSVSNHQGIGVYYTPVSAQTADKCKVDLVFILDTSVSMADEWENLCDIVSEIITDVNSGYDLKAHIIAIGGQPPVSVTCTPEIWTASEACPNDSSGPLEQWGPGVEYWAEHEPWRNCSTRIIMPVSDEGPFCGCGYPIAGTNQDDIDSIEAAISAAKNNHVIVYPLEGLPGLDIPSECTDGVDALMDHLAIETNGQRFNISDYSQMDDAIKTIIANNCVGLNISKNSTSPSCVGGTLSYTINVCNERNDSYTNVSVEDMLDKEVEFDSCGSSDAATTCSYDQTNHTVTWIIPTIAPNSCIALYLEVKIPDTADPGKELINTARVLNATGCPAPLPSAEHRDIVKISRVKVEKTANPVQGTPSTLIDFTIKVTNTGLDVLNSVHVEDTLPIGMSYVSDDHKGTLSGGVIEWDIGPLNPNDFEIIHLQATIDSGVSPGVLTNSVLVIGDSAECPYCPTDSDTANVTVILPTEPGTLVNDPNYNTLKVGNDKAVSLGGIGIKWQNDHQSIAQNNLEIKNNQDSGPCDCCAKLNIEQIKVKNRKATALGQGLAINNIKIVTNQQ